MATPLPYSPSPKHIDSITLTSAIVCHIHVFLKLRINLAAANI